MNEQEIIAYFSPSTVYQFAGSLDELKEFMEATGASYNCIRLGTGEVYFSAMEPVSGDKVTLFHEGTA